jgi:hypothetical protein
MATGRSYSINDLKSSLKTRMAEFEMLNKTLIESIEKGSSEVTLDAIKDAIKDAEENIKVLRDWIEEKTNKDEETNKVQYSLYNEIKKPTLPRSVKVERCKNLSEIKNNLDKLENELKDLKETKDSFFDNIKKDTDSKKLDKVIKKDLSSDYKPYDSPYNHLNYEDMYSETCKKLPVCSPYENVIQCNRFLVRFGTPLDIPEYYVRSVDFKSKHLVISIFNFIKDDEHPIIAELLAKKFNGDMTSEFSISIDYLDPTGVILYTERYHHCHLLDVERDSVDYTRDDFNRILLTVSYSDVTYETSH